MMPSKLQRNKQKHAYRIIYTMRKRFSLCVSSACSCEDEELPRGTDVICSTTPCVTMCLTRIYIVLQENYLFVMRYEDSKKQTI